MIDDTRELWDAEFIGMNGTPLTDPGVVALLAHTAGFAVDGTADTGFLVQPLNPAADNGIRQHCEYGGDDLEVKVPNMGTVRIAGFR